MGGAGAEFGGEKSRWDGGGGHQNGATGDTWVASEGLMRPRVVQLALIVASAYADLSHADPGGWARSGFGATQQLTVNIGLLGFSADGAWQLELDASELYGLLARLLPERRTMCGPDGRSTDATYQIKYNVVQMRTGLQSLHQVLAGAMRPVGSSYASTQYFEVRVADVVESFARTYDSYFASERPNESPSILVINPNRADMASLLKNSMRGGNTDIAYYYTLEDGGPPTQMWVSSGRYMVLDLSAAPGHLGIRGSGEGAVSRASVPVVLPAHQGGEEAAMALANNPALAAMHAAAHTELLAKLAALIISGITHVIAPDVRSCTPPQRWKRLVVPLIVLRNHERFNPLTPGHEFSVDVDAIRTQLQRLLMPGQQLTVLPSVHLVHDHPQIAMALQTSISTEVIHDAAAASGGTPYATNAAGVAVDRPHIDSSSLEYHLAHAVDWLSSGLMERAESAPAIYHLHHGWSNASRVPSTNHFAAVAFAANAKAGDDDTTIDPSDTKVLPLFLFSILGMEPSLLIDRSTLVHASDHSIIVLQTNVSHLPVPFHSGHERSSHGASPPLTVNTRTPTHHALAGLASAVGSLLAPFEAFSETDHLPTVDFHWAVGAHPFGPYSSANELPQLMVDAAHRHVLLATLSAATDLLLDATDAIEALAARYVHPHESLSPAHREQFELLHAHAHSENGGADFDAKMKHLDEEAKGVKHDERRTTNELAQKAAPTGELLRRLKAGTLSLSSDLASIECLRLYAQLDAHSWGLQRAGQLIAQGEVIDVTTLDHLGGLFDAVNLSAAQIHDGVKGLNAMLKCCKVETTRPRSLHLTAVGGLLLIGGVVWLAVLRLTAPDDHRGPAVRMRPGASFASWNLWGRGRSRAAFYGKEY